MSTPPIRKDLQGLLQDHQERINLVERRLGRGGTGSSVPYDANPGMIMPYAGAVAPEGWLFCDGSAVSRTTYATLYSAIGTAYGAGDGSSTFNLPNLKGRVPVGKDAGQTEFDVLGEAGGAKAVTLTIAEMPSHSHQWTAAGTNNPGGVPANWDDIVGANASALGVGPANPETGNGISPRGGGGAHNNLQPYVVTNYIISTGDGTGGGGGSKSTGGGSAPPAAGLVSPWAGADTAIPAGWLLCDGRTISRAGYPALFAAIGVTYGAGDGTNTFNLPNYKGRTLVGRDPAQAEFDVLGETGGEKAVALGDSNMSGRTYMDVSKGSGAPAGWITDSTSGTRWFGTKDSQQIPAGVPHNNLQPYAVANYIIATGAGSSSGVPAVLPVDLWQEFSLAKPGGLRPLSGGYLIWDGPVTGNLGATLSADKTTITFPAPGTYRIITHMGIGATPGQGTAANAEFNGTGYSPSLDYGNAGAAGVYVTHVEFVYNVTAATTMKQWATPGGMYDWSWLRIEKVEPFYPKSTALAVTQGPTVLRDSIYGTPATDTERASLANRKIVWLNTDLGWHESYYAPTGLTGLTARGLISGSPAGWYPIGTGPYMTVVPQAAFAASPGVALRSWQGITDRNGGSAYFSYTDSNGRFQIVRAGRYRIRAWTAQQQGGGIADYHLRQIVNTTTVERTVHFNNPLQAALITAAEVEVIWTHSGGREVDWVVQSGTLTLHAPGIASTMRGEFTLEYLGPALTSD